jgi:hypothetical protein
MFRRWLFSLPDAQEKDANSPVRFPGRDDPKWVTLVGQGSFGKYAASDEDRVTRAYLVPIGKTGRQAWWIGPENHKACIDKAYKPRKLTADEWQTAQGNTSEVGVGGLKEFKAALDSNAAIADKLITTQTLRLSTVDKDKVDERFFDLT